MSPFKPSNRLSYQESSSTIPSLEGNANDRSSALERRFSQSSLPNTSNNKRLSGAPQKNPKRLRRELPEFTKTDEQRVGLADGPGIETDRNSRIGSAPREAWEDEFMQYPENNLVPQEVSLANQVNSESLEHLSDAPNQDSDFLNLFGELDFGNTSASFENPDAEMNLASSSEEASNILSDSFLYNSILGSTDLAEFSTYINDAGDPLDKLSLVDVLNTPFDPNSSGNSLTYLSQGDFSLDFLGGPNPNEDNLLEGQDFEMDFETEPKDSHSTFSSGEPQSLARNANQVEQEKIEKNLRLGIPWKDRERIKDKIRALITFHGLQITDSKLKAEFSKAHPDESCPSLRTFTGNLAQMRKEKREENPELRSLQKVRNPRVEGSKDQIRALIAVHGLEMSVEQLINKFKETHSKEPCPSPCPSFRSFSRYLKQMKEEEMENNPELKFPRKKARPPAIGQKDKILDLIAVHGAQITDRGLQEEFRAAYPNEPCPSLIYLSQNLALIRHVQIEEKPELRDLMNSETDQGKNIRVLIEVNGLLMSATKLQEEFSKVHPNEPCPRLRTFSNHLERMRQKRIAQNPELGAPWKKAEGVGDKIRAFIGENRILLSSAELQEEFSKVHPDEQCPPRNSFRYYRDQMRQKRIAQNPELGAPRKKAEGAGDKIRALIEANSLLMGPAKLQEEFRKAHPNEPCPHINTVYYHLDRMRQKRIAQNPELGAPWKKAEGARDKIRAFRG